MLDYTRMAIKQTASDLKKADYIRKIATQIIYIVYLIYALIVGSGWLAANIILLVLSCSYFVFFLTMTSFGKTPEGKTVKKLGKKIYTWCKRLVKLFTLGLTVYGICTTVGHVSPVSVVLAAMMIVGWVLQIIFDVLIKIVTNRINFILEGLEADLDNLLKPVRSVGNFFKKVTGKEVTPPKEPTKNQLRLKEKVEAYRAEKERKKAEEKIRKSEAKQALKEQKRKEKQSVRIETRLLKEAEKKQALNERKSKKIQPFPSDEPEEETALTADLPLCSGKENDNFPDCTVPENEEKNNFSDDVPFEIQENKVSGKRDKSEFFHSVFGKGRKE